MPKKLTAKEIDDALQWLADTIKMERQLAAEGFVNTSGFAWWPKWRKPTKKRRR